MTLLDGATTRRFLGAGVPSRGSAVRRGRSRKGEPILLEPVMAVEVPTPEEYIGDVIGDLNEPPWPDPGHGGHGGAHIVRALAPIPEMFGYVGDLRSKTQGRANYSMEFDSYAEVPRNVAEERSHSRRFAGLATEILMISVRSGSREHVPYRKPRPTQYAMSCHRPSGAAQTKLRRRTTAAKAKFEWSEPDVQHSKLPCYSSTTARRR